MSTETFETQRDCWEFYSHLDNELLRFLHSNNKPKHGIEFRHSTHNISKIGQRIQLEGKEERNIVQLKQYSLSYLYINLALLRSDRVCMKSAGSTVCTTTWSCIKPSTNGSSQTRNYYDQHINFSIDRASNTVEKS